ncbi:serine/threonine-protein kinase [Kitasatospora paracochleata]|uniref:non-specific serine/threonine protein kinase n=1 Tax=Kitasatospora paracochleata TaxID=58354 RepID=A0ABT1J0W7_9ACTN|nr:serine/threonine-protein kinase [Kitasatospora paracochleata]MCP2311075.1 hypothetical protein [Kitasatospora paracochleata]
MDQDRVIAGRYRLLDRIGSGGMGTVWRARDELLGRDVALKELRVRPELSPAETATVLERTRREARSAARINQRNVVVVHDVVEDGGLPCVVMEYVPSRTLGDALAECGPLSAAETARLGCEVLAGLRAAHAAGVLHRDVKPSNVLLGLDGRVVLTDFGIASTADDSTLTRTGELVGSVDYLAPELIRGGRPSPASDLWALGATLYQAVEGTPPFRRPTAIETAMAVASDPLERPLRAGPLAPLIEALLAKEPFERPSAEAAGLLLRDAAGERTAVLPVADLATTVASRPTAYTSTGAFPQVGTLADAGGDGPLAVAGGTALLPRPTPSPDPVPAPAAAPGRQRTGRRTAARRAVVVAVVLAAAIAGPSALDLGRKHGGGEAQTQQQTPTATGSAPATPREGYRSVQESGLGAAFLVPDAWIRKPLADPDLTGGINYVDAAGQVSLRLGLVAPADAPALEHWEGDEARSTAAGRLPGYRRLRMERTTYQGLPAAVWDFTFTGKTREYRVSCLAVERGGTLFSVYLSAPSADWARNRAVLDAVLDSLRLSQDGPGPGAGPVSGSGSGSGLG